LKNWILLLLLLSSQSSLAASASLEEVNLQLDEKHPFQSAGFIMAKEQGFYREAGFLVHFNLPSHANVSQPALDNPTHFVLRPLGIDAEALKDSSIVLLANYFTYPPQTFISPILSKEAATSSHERPTDADMVLSTSLGYALQNPANTLNFIKASNKGWAYALSHRPKTLTALLKVHSSIIDKAEPTIPASHAEKDIHKPSVEVIEAEVGELSYGPLLTLKEQAYLLKKGNITLCVDPHWMPYESIDNGRHIGIGSEYYAFFENKLGIPFTLVPTQSWRESLAKGQTRACDILSLASSSKERMKHWNFTPPVISVPLVLTTQMDKPFVNSIEQILDKKLGVGSGYSYGEHLRSHYKNIHLVDTNTLKSGFDQVISGALYGQLGALAASAYLLQDNYTGQLKISGKFVDKLALNIAVRNDDQVLLSILSKAVLSIPASMHLQIRNNWVTVNITEESEPAYLWYLWPTLALLLLLLIAGSIRLYIQKKYVFKLEAANSKIQTQNRILQNLSTTDALTQVYNRLKLDLILADNLALFEAGQQTFSIILLDVDHFKQVNDHFGHIVGDKILVKISQILQQTLHKPHSIGRWGGEEFLVICPHTSESEAQNIADNILCTLRAAKFEHQQPVTLSAGVVQMQPNSCLETLFKQADEALYYAKSTGRDRVVSYRLYTKLKTEQLPQNMDDLLAG